MAQAAMSPQEFEAEMQALKKCREAMANLDYEARDRILDWLRGWMRQEAPNRNDGMF